MNLMLVILFSIFVGNFQPYESTTTTLVGRVRIVSQPTHQKYQHDGVLIMTPQPQVREPYIFMVNNGKLQSGAYVRRAMHYRVQFVDMFGRTHWDQLWYIDGTAVDVQRIKNIKRGK